MSAKRVKASSPEAPVPQDVIAILESIIEERDRAMAKFGVQSHPDGTGGGAAAILRDQQRDLVDEQARTGKSNWRDILMEEVREAFAETDLVALDKELCQVQQVCLVWREDLARRMAPGVVGSLTELAAEDLLDALADNAAKGYEGRPFVLMTEASAREMAARFNGNALRSLANGGFPGRRWMLDNLSALKMTVTGEPFNDLARLEDWVKSLDASWWDVNFSPAEQRERQQRRRDEQEKKNASSQSAPF